MTTDTMRPHDSQPAVAEIVTPHLTADEHDVLLKCVNAVRAGEIEFYVKVTNRKVTNSKKRMPGEHYEPDPTLVPGAHKGWLVAAPINQKGKVYLHIYDEARAKSKADRFGHTRITMEGIRSFAVEFDPRSYEPITRPGPLGDHDPTPEGQAPQAVATFDAALAAQALILQSQALMCQAQALMLRAYENPPT